MDWSEIIQQPNVTRDMVGRGFAARVFKVWDVDRQKIISDPVHVTNNRSEGLPAYGDALPGYEELGLKLDSYSVSLDMPVLNVVANYSTEQFAFDRVSSSDVYIKSSIPIAVLRRTSQIVKGVEQELTNIRVWEIEDFPVEIIATRISIKGYFPFAMQGTPIQTRQQALDQINDQLGHLHAGMLGANAPNPGGGRRLSYYRFEAGNLDQLSRNWCSVSYQWVGEMRLDSPNQDSEVSPLQQQADGTGVIFPPTFRSKLPNDNRFYIVPPHEKIKAFYYVSADPGERPDPFNPIQPFFRSFLPYRFDDPSEWVSLPGLS